MKITRIEGGKKVVYLQLKDIAWMYDRGDFFKCEKIVVNGKESQYFHETPLGIYGKIFKNERERFGPEQMQRYFKFEDEEEIAFIESQQVIYHVEGYVGDETYRGSDGEYRNRRQKTYREEKCSAFLEWADCKDLSSTEFYGGYGKIQDAFVWAETQLEYSLFPLYGEKKEKVKRTKSALCNLAKDIRLIYNAKQGKYNSKGQLIKVPMPEEDEPLPQEPELAENEGMFF